MIQGTLALAYNNGRIKNARIRTERRHSRSTQYEASMSITVFGEFT